MISLLYFAWVRESIGIGEEQIEPGAATVAELLDQLPSRSPGHAAALADRGAIRVAVDQAFVGFDAPVRDGSEVAIFPPVTGG
ncbi:molybdopterin converting factor subunit 1 [Glacieibacterium sp.]|uniref:molybdopterin converting factor subunit 1 n=1 Tax=Glacieibacterium sp. TaxID=2860237 RepID=UPI003AFFE54F